LQFFPYPGIAQGQHRKIKSCSEILRFSEDETVKDTNLWKTLKNSVDFYDEKGHITRSEVYKEDGSIEIPREYKYNEKGLLSQLTTDGNIFKYTYDTKDSLVKYETYGKDQCNLEEVRTYTYTHDKKAMPGKWSKKNDVSYISIINILDSANRVIAIEANYEEGDYEKTVFTYDKLGHLIYEKTVSDVEADETTKYFYTNGKLSKKVIDDHGTTIDYYNEKGQLTKSVYDGRVEINKYNTDGNLISNMRYDPKGQLEEITRYVYEFY
jgi:antitoxin component YwqK of YwqJK toxin-antitoxin module